MSVSGDGPMNKPSIGLKAPNRWLQPPHRAIATEFNVLIKWSMIRALWVNRVQGWLGGLIKATALITIGIG
ncbi:hypothetical protein [Vulcanisaeta souniana]|uniref:hypothetical protein n=1 Tax=Vulcanisaeta souniana TaxID=164452 RepID=UPI0006D20896|nr:hypothetical protein [Vulcanisaeta souniana]